MVYDMEVGYGRLRQGAGAQFLCRDCVGLRWSGLGVQAGCLWGRGIAYRFRAGIRVSGLGFRVWARFRAGIRV